MSDTAMSLKTKRLEDQEEEKNPLEPLTKKARLVEEKEKEKEEETATTTFKLLSKFDPSIAWWLFLCYHSELGICSILFDPASKKNVHERELVVAQLKLDPGIILYDMYNEHNHPSEIQGLKERLFRLGGTCCIVPYKEEIEHSGGCLRIAQVMEIRGGDEEDVF